jgi:type VI secretion system protein ImpL
MFAFLRRSFVLLLGFLLIVVFIWFAGPYFAFADFRPLESETARLIAIGVVVGCWLLARLWKRLKAYRASDRLLTAVVAQPQPEKARPPAEVAKLRERFEEAVSGLKQQRRSGHSLYDLPWYVIIGAPGSGKTTALLNSGLKFPLEQRVGKGALRGVGGTRNCDWWFTDEAIFLDTAGRYTTQDSDASSDRVGWSEFLALLRKYRARRPLNGVIVTVSVQDLLMLDPSAREAHVEAARNRLMELNRELRIQLPVYLMVTKCDLVTVRRVFRGLDRGRARASVGRHVSLRTDACQRESARLSGGVRRADDAAERARVRPSRGSPRHPAPDQGVCVPRRWPRCGRR